MERLSEITSKYNNIIESLKILHFNAASTPNHEHYGYGYDSVIESHDAVMEQLMGYSNMRIDVAGIDKTVELYLTQEKIISEIYRLAENLIKLAEAKGFYNIENLGQELSGVGAKLNYLLNLDK